MALSESSLIERLPIAAFVIDSKHQVIHWNRACAQLTGVAKDQVLGTSDQWKPFYPAARPVMCDMIVAQASEDELRALYGDKFRASACPGAFEAEDFFPTLPGGGRWLLFTAAPLVDDDGRLVGAIQTCADITDRRLAAAERIAAERLLTEIIQGNPVPTFVIDAEHRVTHWNRACEIVMGVSEAGMVGSRDQWRAFYPNPRPVMADLVLDQAQSNEVSRYYREFKQSPFIEGAFESEDFFPNFPGGGRWLFFTAAPLRGRDGQVIGAIETLQDTTERKRAEIAFAESERRLAEEKYKVLFNEMINGFALQEIITNDQGQPVDYRFLDVNPAFEQITGLGATDILGKRVLEVLPNIDIVWIERFGRVALTGEPDSFEAYSQDMGKTFEVRAFRPAPGQFAITFQDVTSRKEAEIRLQLLASVYEQLQEGIIITDAAGVIMEVNDSFVRITGFERDYAVGKTPRILKSGRHDADFYQRMWTTLLAEGVWRGEIWNRRRNGEVFPEALTISAVRDEQGHPSHFLGVVVDITAIKQHQAELDRIAHYDSLTGLPNRVLLNDRLQQATAKAHRENTLLAVCFLDVDGFKPVNDAHGHSAGDHLLIELAERFRSVLRGSETVARLGGDEFVILLSDLHDRVVCIEILQRILRAVSQPFAIGSRLVSVTASIGVTLFPLEATDTDTLIRQADQAMYKSKQMGKNTYFFYDGSQDAVAIENQRVIQRIGEALADHELVLHYQPKVNMRTGAVVGAEALVRWQHPERGLLPPGEFLPTIEGTEVIVALGEWVIREALRQMQEWQEQGLEIGVSVNIAAHHLQSPTFIEHLEQALEHSDRGDQPGLEIEITETAAINDLKHVTDLIERCHGLGVRFALDDFGTGYSSLTYLKLLPVQTLKIDRSFVLDMERDSEDHAIVAGVAGLARAFGLAVIAEGVETARHRQLLLDLECELGQGFGIAPPMPAEKFPEWVCHWMASDGSSARGRC